MACEDDLEQRAFLASYLRSPQFLGTTEEQIDDALTLTLRAVKKRQDFARTGDTDDLRKSAYFSSLAGELLTEWSEGVAAPSASARKIN